MWGRSFVASLSPILLCFLLAAPTFGQQGAAGGQQLSTAGGQLSPTGDGSVSLTIQVIGEDHAFLDGQAFVRVRTAQGPAGERWDTTGRRNDVTISGLFEGVYDVEVSALGYKTSSTRVDLFGVPMQTVQVTLKRDPNADSYVTPKLDISSKARTAAERGLLALQMGNLKEAEHRMRAALKDAPQNAQVNYLLGVILLKEKATDEAEKCFFHATELDAGHVQALTALGALRLQQKNYAAAADFLTRSIAGDSHQWRAHWLLASTRLMQHEPALAEAQLAFDLSRGVVPLTTLVLGEAQANAGQTATAIATLRRFLEQSPTSPDVPAVQQMIAALEEQSEAGVVRTVSVNVSGITSRTAPALATLSPAWAPPGVDDVLPPVISGATCPLPRVLEGTAKVIKDLADDLDRFSATETQTHEALDVLGNPLTRQSRKNEYIAQLSQPRSGFLQFNEYRRNLSDLGPFTDGLATQGMLGLAFVFHPALQENYEMVCEGLGAWNGESAWLVHFRQKVDRPRRVQVFKAGAQNHEVALKGRAWISAAGFKVLRIEAELTEPMIEAQLMQEHQIANYGPVEFKTKNTQLWLPKDTETYLEYRGHRFRLSDHFESFVLFSVDSQQKDKAPVSHDK